MEPSQKLYIGAEPRQYSSNPISPCNWHRDISIYNF